MKKLINFLLLFLVIQECWAVYQPQFSTAGFFQLKDSGREVYSMNPGWRFFKGSQKDAELKDFNDKQWSLVSLPHGIEYLPTEASGCVNYQGEVWYRKHFHANEDLRGKKLFLHFEAIMGKSKVYVNGKLVKENFGGYLPVVVDVTDHVLFNEDNVLAVWADNSNDGFYPPGKPQETLDYTYFGGIYRDCWLVAHNKVYVTDPNFEDEVAGGGLFVSFGKVNDELAEVTVKTHLRNSCDKVFRGYIEYSLLQKDGTPVASARHKLTIKRRGANTVIDGMKVENPNLWSPSSPYLYELLVKVSDDKG